MLFKSIKKSYNYEGKRLNDLAKDSIRFAIDTMRFKNAEMSKVLKIH